MKGTDVKCEDREYKEKQNERISASQCNNVMRFLFNWVSGHSCVLLMCIFTD